MFFLSFMFIFCELNSYIFIFFFPSILMERRALHMTDEHSTTELYPHFILIFLSCGNWRSNPGPLTCYQSMNLLESKSTPPINKISSTILCYYLQLQYIIQNSRQRFKRKTIVLCAREQNAFSFYIQQKAYY